MKKTLLAGALLAVSTGLAACGQSGSGQQADNTTAAPETTTAAQTQAAKETTVVTGEAEGYGGTITAEVTLDGDKIVDLKLTGDGETPAIGGAALESLQAAIIEKGTIDGVDTVSGATWTSNGAFDAVRRALGIETEGNDGKEQKKEVSATGLSHGIGFFSSGRLGPGKDDKDTGVYSINEVIAYVDRKSVV